MIHSSHEHPEAIFGVGLDAVTHASDRKWLFALSLVLFTFLPMITTITWKMYNGFYKILRNQLVARSFFVIRKLFDPFTKALRRGLVQTLVYE